MSVPIMLAASATVLAIPAIFVLLYFVMARDTARRGTLKAAHVATGPQPESERAVTRARRSTGGPATVPRTGQEARPVANPAPAADTPATETPTADSNVDPGLTLSWEPDAERFDFNSGGQRSAATSGGGTSAKPAGAPGRRQPAAKPAVPTSPPDPVAPVASDAADQSAPAPAPAQTPPRTSARKTVAPPAAAPPRVRRDEQPLHDEVPIPDRAPPMQASFRLSPASGLRFAAPADAEMEKVEEALAQAFTPTRPKQTAQDLVGCEEEVARAIAAIEEPAHLVIFGERGRGKTSLANVLTSLAKDNGYLVARYSCGTDVTFSEMFGAVIGKIPARLLQSTAKKRAKITEIAEPQDDAKDITPASATERFCSIKRGHVLIHIDEFDRVDDPAVKRQLAETIKAVSDAAAPVTFLITGVADDLETLLGEHPSIQRNIVPLHMRARRPDEVERILDVGAQAAGVQFDPDVQAAIIGCSAGLPYFAQLLAHHAGRAAIAAHRSQVSVADFARARMQVLGDLNHALERKLGDATRGKPILQNLVYSAALSKSDSAGGFRAPTVAARLAELVGQQVDEPAVERTLNRFATAEGGSLLHKAGTGESAVFLFDHPLMRQFVLLDRWGNDDAPARGPGGADGTNTSEGNDGENPSE